MLPFLSLVSVAELQRNPTVKDEAKSAGITSIGGLLLTYPVHQAADILFCKANVVPVGRDQLPHLEQTRVVARRFNDRYGKVFPEPGALLSEATLILGTDGTKMSKSKGNVVELRMTCRRDGQEAQGRQDRQRPGHHLRPRPPARGRQPAAPHPVRGRRPEAVAEEIGDGGGGALKGPAHRRDQHRARPRCAPAVPSSRPTRGTSTRSSGAATPGPTRSPRPPSTRSARRWAWSTAGPRRRLPPDQDPVRHAGRRVREERPGMAPARRAAPCARCPARARSATIGASSARRRRTPSSTSRPPAFYEAPATLPTGQRASSARADDFLSTRSTPPAWSATPSGCSTRPPTAPGAHRRHAAPSWCPAWIGVGSRPVIGYAPGTQGMADRCAPSWRSSRRASSTRHRHRGPAAAGYAVAMPDYEGLGTAGVHTYMDRVPGPRHPRRGTRRAAPVRHRAAVDQPGRPMGYSQGGGPALRGRARPPTYAPDLRGARAPSSARCRPTSPRWPPTSTAGCSPAFAFFALRGLAASHDLDLTPYLNAPARGDGRRRAGLRVRPARQRLRRSGDAERGRPADVGADEAGAVRLDHRGAADRHHQAECRCWSPTPHSTTPSPTAWARRWRSRGAARGQRALRPTPPAHVGGMAPHARGAAVLRGPLRRLPRSATAGSRSEAQTAGATPSRRLGDQVGPG